MSEEKTIDPIDPVDNYGSKILKGCLYLVDNQGVSILDIIGMLNKVSMEMVTKGQLEKEDEEEEYEEDDWEEDGEELEEGFTLTPPQDDLENTSGQPLVTPGWSPSSDEDDP